jgi:hypothetical protein
VFYVVIRHWQEWNRVRSPLAYVVMFVYNTRHRKTTIIIFKILGIERAWRNQGNVGLRPRQIFITKSRRLANKVEEEYVNLLFSLCNGSEMPEDIRERIQSWNKRKKMNTSDLGDNKDDRGDLPQRYSQLRDEHFPLFSTTDTVSTTFVSYEREK